MKRKRRKHPDPAELHDHTAPFRCGLEGCATCSSKPRYAEWHAIATRRRQEAAARARARG